VKFFLQIQVDRERNEKEKDNTLIAKEGGHTPASEERETTKQKGHSPAEGKPSLDYLHPHA